MREVLSSKIHKATVTGARVDYEGSITIDADLMDLVDLWRHQKVLVVDNTNGARLETYVISGERGSGVIQMNGAAAHLIQSGDEIIIMGFDLAGDSVKQPKSITVDKSNKYVRTL
jgi:aspartate 1-decarboxylase